MQRQKNMLQITTMRIKSTIFYKCLSSHTRTKPCMALHVSPAADFQCDHFPPSPSWFAPHHTVPAPLGLPYLAFHMQGYGLSLQASTPFNAVREAADLERRVNKALQMRHGQVFTATVRARQVRPATRSADMHVITDSTSILTCTDRPCHGCCMYQTCSIVSQLLNLLKTMSNCHVHSL